LFLIALTYVHRRDRQIPIRIDHRTRRDRTERRNKAFDKQMDALIDAYMVWSLASSNRERAGFYSGTMDQHIPANAGMVTVKVVDVYST
jgi:hypothetical protein